MSKGKQKVSDSPERGKSIRRQLVTLGVYMTAMALVLLMLSTLLYETVEKRRTLISGLYVGAEVIGRNSAAAILFNDQGDAREVLESLSAAPDILHAAIILPDGSLLAEYRAEGSHPCQSLDAAGEGLMLRWCSMLLYSPVMLHGEQIATVAIEYSLKPLLRRSLYGLVFGLCAILITLGVAFSAWRRIAARITSPLIHLIQVTQQVQEKQDFSLRVDINSQDEVGRLSHTFNRMMSQLQLHELRLQQELKQRCKAEERLNLLAYHDNVTPLFNRHYFMEQFDSVVSNTLLHGNACALLFIDLDGFKKVNDTLGHDIGDKLLYQVATRLQGGVRSTDIVCRLGGDEFAVIVKQDASREQTEHLSGRLIELMAPCYLLDGHKVFVTASIGVSLCPEQAQDNSALIKYADIAMYQAKAKGKNCFCVYDAASEQHINEHFRIENDLRNALSANQLQLYYQPIFSANEHTLVGFEALLRWQHPDLGWIQPDVFIPIAESIELMVPIGKWVLEQAAQQLLKWRKLNADLCISINVSAQQLVSDQTVQELIATLHKYGLSQGAIELELTDSCLLEKSDNIRQRIQHLLDAGFQLAVDDFGTGYSSLSNLHYFPFTRIKIDCSFVKRINECIESQALVRAIVAIGSTLNIAVTADGIENLGQIDMLENLGCKYLQGYALGQPLPYLEASEKLAVQTL